METHTQPEPQPQTQPQTQLLNQKAMDLQYLSQALDLARLSPPKPTNFRVGCVIVAFPLTTSSGGSGGGSNSSASEPQLQVGHQSQDGHQSQVSAQSQVIKPPSILSTGYTLELPGNTHAEQNALAKLAARHNLPESQVGECPEFLEPGVQVVLYTTLEPCAKRLSGNLPCVERILGTRRKTRTTRTTTMGSQGGGSDEDTSGGISVTATPTTPPSTATPTTPPSTATPTTHTFISGIHRVVYGAKEPDTFVQKSVATRVLEDAGIEVDYVGDLEDEILRVAMQGHVPAKEVDGGTSGNTTTPTTAANANSTSQSQNQSQNQSQSTGSTTTQHDHHHTETNIDDITPEERRRQEALPRNPKKRMMEVDIPPRA
ncbi:hypothetical protein A1O1_02133 [Capronia coronata CBS 617.96]|uniref:CMP/dCMP-type deaminase domain-containing protein n=1 Tax=Capronia coronata CBS 617.96 TaxID=1182541 RepID=W9YVM8_9EURO|nr:uncharacterized protein A1O1_02133 [Capronia coronata CBS 617.96]EXJ93740.1 hypothetical protein A1O1_02133 [Capronia coronata CBS 617.96]